MLCVPPFDFGEKFSNSLWLLWKSSSLAFWRYIWKLWISSVPFPREALAFLKWAGGRVPDTLIKLHIMKCQEELTEYLCLLDPWPSIIASDYSITAEHFKVIVEIGCKCEATKAVLKLGRIMDRHPNCEAVWPDLSQVGCYPGWIMISFQWSYMVKSDRTRLGSVTFLPSLQIPESGSFDWLQCLGFGHFYKNCHWWAPWFEQWSSGKQIAELAEVWRSNLCLSGLDHSQWIHG